MRMSRISSIERDRPFLAVDRSGYAVLLRVVQPAWEGPGEGDQVKARPEPIRDPADLGLAVRRLADLETGTLFLLPELDRGWKLYKVLPTIEVLYSVRVAHVGPGGSELAVMLMDYEARVYAKP